MRSSKGTAVLVVCSENHDPVCWDPSQTDECWMCGRSIRRPPADARYSEVRGDKDSLDEDRTKAEPVVAALES